MVRLVIFGDQIIIGIEKLTYNSKKLNIVKLYSAILIYHLNYIQIKYNNFIFNYCLLKYSEYIIIKNIILFLVFY